MTESEKTNENISESENKTYEQKTENITQNITTNNENKTENNENKTKLKESQESKTQSQKNNTPSSFNLLYEIDQLSLIENEFIEIGDCEIPGYQKSILITINKSIIENCKSDLNEDVEFILLIKYNHPKIAPSIFCITNFCYPEISDPRDLIDDIVGGPWKKNNKSIKEIIELIPIFINNYTKKISDKNFIPSIGKFYLDCTYELNIIKLFPYLCLDDVYEVVSLSNDKKSYLQKRKMMLTEGFVLLFIDNSIFETEKMKLIFFGSINSLSMIKQVKDIIELSWRVKKNKLSLMRLKTNDVEKIMGELIKCLKKTKAKFDVINESKEKKTGELPKIDIVSVERKISKLEIKIKINGKSKANDENAKQLMKLYEKAVQYYSAINDKRFEVHLKKIRKLCNDMGKDKNEKGGEKKEDKKTGKKKKDKKEGDNGDKKKKQVSNKKDEKTISSESTINTEDKKESDDSETNDKNEKTQKDNIDQSKENKEENIKNNETEEKKQEENTDNIKVEEKHETKENEPKIEEKKDNEKDKEKQKTENEEQKKEIKKEENVPNVKKEEKKSSKNDKSKKDKKKNDLKESIKNSNFNLDLDDDE